MENRIFLAEYLGAAVRTQETVQELPRLALSYYFILATGCCVLLALLWALLPHQGKAGCARACAARLLPFFVAWLVCSLAVCRGFHFTVFDFTEKFISILLGTVLLYLVWGVAAEIFRWKHTSR